MPVLGVKLSFLWACPYEPMTIVDRRVRITAPVFYGEHNNTSFWRHKTTLLLR